MLKHTSILLLTILLLATACSNETESPKNIEIIIGPTVTAPSQGYVAPGESIEVPSSYPAPDTAGEPVDSGYPPPGAAFVPSTPYPGAATPVQTKTPAPDELVQPEPPNPSAGHGAVVGQLFHKDSESPGSNLTIYLGIKVEANPGPGYLISTQRNSSPQADTNGAGYFVINDVEPGTYALVIGSLIGSRVLENPENGQEYWVEVASGEISDVGNVVFTFP